MTTVKARNGKAMRQNCKATDTRNTRTPYPNGLRMPKYRLHKASGRGVIQYKPLWGKEPHYLEGDFNSPQSLADYARCCELVAKHKIHRVAVKQDVRPTRKSVTVRRLLERFMLWAKEHFADNPREFSHFKLAARDLRMKYGARPVRAIGPVRLKRVRERMIKRGWCRTHVNHQFNRLRNVFAWGVENELVGPNHMDRLAAIRGLRKGHTTAPEREPVRKVDWAEASRVVPFLPPVVAAMVEIQYLTGMRSSELTAMRIADINFRGSVWVYTPSKHKTAYLGKSKNVCLGPRAQALLIPYLQCPPEDHLFSPRIAQRERFEARQQAAKHKRYGKRKASTFNPSAYRERFDTVSYHHAINYGFDRMDRKAKKKVSRWHPHQLRHSRSTLTRERYGLEGSQAQIGNTKEMTEHYAEKSLPLAMQIALETG